ncbi:hypothetical protein HELRODRAFT_168676 [Helobdella robusta]|uniref:UBX domain-containing protein n=1 Tax=Helobdella robusta TaxID=6412 RepID=T1F0U8_HELRO|nr:hypothetical protein HELRODRAFT_168676 [Helobdella robusta]ESO08772.1 hypothetical protein HELRODRAFT_168676 [Helobdella robusta]
MNQTEIHNNKKKNFDPSKIKLDLNDLPTIPARLGSARYKVLPEIRQKLSTDQLTKNQKNSQISHEKPASKVSEKIHSKINETSSKPLSISSGKITSKTKNNDEINVSEDDITTITTSNPINIAIKMPSGHLMKGLFSPTNTLNDILKYVINKNSPPDKNVRQGGVISRRHFLNKNSLLSKGTNETNVCVSSPASKSFTNASTNNLNNVSIYNWTPVVIDLLEFYLFDV